VICRLGRPRVSTIVLAAGILLGTGLVIWGSDVLARWGAESLLARHVQAATGVPERPSVEVRGAFFLPQVLSGRYDEVDIAADDLTSGPLRIGRLEAELRGVHLTFHDLLWQNSVPIYIEQSRERATLSYDALNSYLDATGRSVRIATAPAGETMLTGTFQVFGRGVSASAMAILAADAGDLTVRPTQVETGTELDGASRALLRQRFSFVVPMDPLPFGQRLTGIETTDTAVVVDAEGRDVVVQP
jgi:LmeA-like phospholipid-binding